PKVQDRCEFVLCWGASGAEAKSISGACLIVLSAFLVNFQAHRLTGFHKRLFVERRQCLQRSIRASAPSAGEFGGRRVEGQQGRKWKRPFPEGVHASAISLLAGAFGPGEAAINS